MTSGSFNYVSSDIESSLYRNGRMLLRRGLDGSDSGFEGVELDDQYTKPTLKNLYAIWKRPVHIHTRRKGKRDDSSKGVLVSYDGSQHHEEELELEG